MLLLLSAITSSHFRETFHQLIHMYIWYN